jgi:hypothetical protein
MLNSLSGVNEDEAPSSSEVNEATAVPAAYDPLSATEI